MGGYVLGQMSKNANVICEGSLLEEVSFESVKLNDLTLTFQLSMKSWWMMNMVQIQTLIHKSFRILVGYP